MAVSIKAIKGLSLPTSKESSVDMYKYNSEGTATVSGKPICFLLNRKAIKRINVERNLKTQEKTLICNFFRGCTLGKNKFNSIY